MSPFFLSTQRPSAHLTPSRWHQFNAKPEAVRTDKIQDLKTEECHAVAGGPQVRNEADV